MLDLLARPTGFEPVTLGLEMQVIGYTNDLVLHRFVILQYLFYNVPILLLPLLSLPTYLLFFVCSLLNHMLI